MMRETIAARRRTNGCDAERTCQRSFRAESCDPATKSYARIMRSSTIPVGGRDVRPSPAAEVLESGSSVHVYAAHAQVRTCAGHCDAADKREPRTPTGGSMEVSREL